MTPDDPRNPIDGGMIPSFSPAEPRPLAETPTTPGNPRPSPPLDPFQPDLPMPKQVLRATRTDTSATTEDKADAKLTGELIAGLLAVAVTVTAVVLRRWRRRDLREPTTAQLDDIAAPLGNIAARHLPGAGLNRDLTDALKAAAALGTYLKDGDITMPVIRRPQITVNTEQPDE